MSHFTKVRTEIRDKACLKKALKKLGYAFEEGENVSLVGYFEHDRTADIVIRKRNLPGRLGTYTDVGFSRNSDGTYELIIDDYFPSASKEFADAISQAYAYQVVVSNAALQGYSVEEEQNMQDGSVRLVMTKW